MKKSVFSIAVLSALMLIFAACSNSSGGGSGNGNSGNGGSGGDGKTSYDIKISGHIKETLDYDYDVKPYECFVETKKVGKLEITAEYDYEVLLNIVDKKSGKVKGVINFSNPELDYNTIQQLNFIGMHKAYSSPYHECQITVGFENDEEPETYYMTYNLSGTIKDGKCELQYDDWKGPLNFYNVTGKTRWAVICTKGVENLSNVCDVTLHIGGENKPLYDFTLENGSQTITENEFKDDFFTTVCYTATYWNQCEGLYNLDGFDTLVKTLKAAQTVQTMTIELPEDYE